LVSNSDILVGEHIQTRSTSKPTVLSMEHSISWTVILIFLWENIFKQKSLQNPRFYSWSILKVGQWLCNSCGKTYSNKENYKTHDFYSWSILKVGPWFWNSCGNTYSNKKHFKTHDFYSWSILKVGQWFCNSCGKTY
jgi:hypothetical protein